MDINEWNNGRNIWAPLIGRLMLAFGEVEYCFMVCLGPLDSHETWQRFKHFELKKKAAKSIEVLANNYDTYPEARRAIYLINEALKRARIRNLVAHNPLNISPYNSPDNNIEFQLVISSLREDQVAITEAGILEIVDEIEKIARELHDIVSNIWTEAD